MDALDPLTLHINPKITATTRLSIDLFEHKFHYAGRFIEFNE